MILTKTLNSSLLFILSLLAVTGCSSVVPILGQNEGENHELEVLISKATTQILENKHGEFRFGGYVLFDTTNAQAKAMPEYKFRLETLELDWIENEQLGENSRHIIFLGRTFDKSGWIFAGQSKQKKKILSKAAKIPRNITPGSSFAILLETKKDGFYALWYREESSITQP